MCISQLKEIIEIVQAVVSVVAITVAALWTWLLFVRTRQKYPRANITHRLAHRPITDGKRLLRVIVEISNVGDVLLSLIQGQARIQQIEGGQDVTG